MESNNNLVHYDRSSFQRVYTTTKRPVLLISPKDGRFVINKAASTLIGLKAGDAIAFVQDREDPTMWGLAPCPASSGFVLRSRRKSSLSFNCLQLAKRLASVFGMQTSFQAQVGTEKTNGYYWLINRSVR